MNHLYHPIVNVWLDHELRRPKIPCSADVLLQILAEEYKITPEEVRNIANPKKRRFQFTMAPNMKELVNKYY